jgi:microcystin-dependent protein
MPKIGDYKMSAQTTDHDNWMLCNGREILRTKYNQLFNLLSIKFGTGNNSTTFNIPKIIQNNLFQNTFIFYGLV